MVNFPDYEKTEVNSLHRTLEGAENRKKRLKQDDFYTDFFIEEWELEE